MAYKNDVTTIVELNDLYKVQLIIYSITSSYSWQKNHLRLMMKEQVIATTEKTNQDAKKWALRTIKALSKRRAVQAEKAQSQADYFNSESERLKLLHQELK